MMAMLKRLFVLAVLWCACTSLVVGEHPLDLSDTFWGESADIDDDDSFVDAISFLLEDNEEGVQDGEEMEGILISSIPNPIKTYQVNRLKSQGKKTLQANEAAYKKELDEINRRHDARANPNDNPIKKAYNDDFRKNDVSAATRKFDEKQWSDRKNINDKIKAKSTDPTRDKIPKIQPLDKESFDKVLPVMKHNRESAKAMKAGKSAAAEDV